MVRRPCGVCYATVGAAARPDARRARQPRRRPRPRPGPCGNRPSASTSTVRNRGPPMICRTLSARAGRRPSMAWPTSWMIQPSTNAARNTEPDSTRDCRATQSATDQQDQREGELDRRDGPVQAEVIDADPKVEERGRRDRQHLRVDEAEPSQEEEQRERHQRDAEEVRHLVASAGRGDKPRSSASAASRSTWSGSSSFSRSRRGDREPGILYRHSSAATRSEVILARGPRPRTPSPPAPARGDGPVPSAFRQV